MVNSFKKLSGDITKNAKVGGSDEQYVIWLMNDQNENMVLDGFSNGAQLNS